MPEKLLTNYFKNENLIVNLTGREVDDACYDAFCSYDGYVKEIFDIICKNCNSTLATDCVQMDGGYKYWTGPRIDRDTVCPKCGAPLFDEKAVVVNDKIENNQNDVLENKKDIKIDNTPGLDKQGAMRKAEENGETGSPCEYCNRGDCIECRFSR